MSLPPLANLFTLHEPNEEARRDVRRRLEQTPEFASVWEPSPGWVAASAPLPGGEPDGHDVRELGFAFAEGRDRVGATREFLLDLQETVARRPQELARHQGDFGFLFFAAGGTLMVVRSCGGLVPFYYSLDDSRVAAATRLDYLLRFFRRDLPLDPLVNAVWAGKATLLPEGRTLFAGVSALRRGRYVQLRAREPAAPVAYWDPRPQRESDLVRSPERPSLFRELLVRTLERELDPDGRNLLALSGGVDSSSLGALAPRAAGRQTAALSIVGPTGELQRRDLYFIELLAREVGIERRWTIVLTPASSLEMLLGAPTVAHHVAHPVLCALPKVLEEAPLGVLFGGEFADEVCGSHPTLPDWTAHTSLPTLLASLGRLPYGPSDLLRWTKHRLLRLAGRPRILYSGELEKLVQPDLRDEYRDWLHHRRQALADESRPLSHLALLAEDDGFLAQSWEVASALGVRRSFPFVTREMLEFAFRSHPRDLVGPGMKKLLRTALADDVPAENIGRTDKGGWGPTFREARCLWEAPLPDAFGQIVRPDWFPVPPRPITWGEASGLAQLAKFDDNVQYMRTGAEPDARLAIHDWGGNWRIRVTKERGSRPSDRTRATSAPGSRCSAPLRS
jgi:asparagine synthetase B (glutamine-hydrolysing)